MQGRYVGDIGDFFKFGLLRALCRADVIGRRLRLGVVWYLVPDESHNGDGRHVDYLRGEGDVATRLRQCDSALYQRLRTLVDSRQRNIEALEAGGVLPRGTRTHREFVPCAGAGPRLGRTGCAALRSGWLTRALASTATCDLVFLDPDNGLAPTACQQHHPAAAKYVFLDEVAQFVRRDQAVVVYQHADRSADVATQAKRRLNLLARAVGRTPLGAVRSHRGSSRLFLVVPSDGERAFMDGRIRWFAEESPWQRDVSFMPYT